MGMSVEQEKRSCELTCGVCGGFFGNRILLGASVIINLCEVCLFKLKAIRGRSPGLLFLRFSDGHDVQRCHSICTI